MMHQPQSKPCFTIGHSNHPIDRFIALVQDAGISTIIDVRSSPYSRFNPQYNRRTLMSSSQPRAPDGPLGRENLEQALTERGIGYVFMGDSLGGRYTDPALLLPGGTPDYRKVQETERFRKGIDRVLAILLGKETVALMCAERDPVRCHRFLLVAPVLEEAGVKVVHVLASGTLKDHAELAGSSSGNGQVDLSGKPVV